MIRAIGLHAWLLLTCRHNGAGLPAKSYVGVFGAFALCCVIAAVRWSDAHLASQSIGAMALILWLVSSFSIRAATGYAMISVSVDLLAIVVPPFAALAGYVELIASLALFYRIYRAI